VRDPYCLLSRIWMIFPVEYSLVQGKFWLIDWCACLWQLSPQSAWFYTSSSLYTATKFKLTFVLNLVIILIYFIWTVLLRIASIFIFIYFMFCTNICSWLPLHSIEQWSIHYWLPSLDLCLSILIWPCKLVNCQYLSNSQLLVTQWEFTPEVNYSSSRTITRAMLDFPKLCGGLFCL
jgi:hypothetical protein